MSHFDLWQEASRQRDKYLGQRNELLAAAKRVVRSELLVAADDLDKWQRVMRELHGAIDRCERDSADEEMA